MGVKAARRCRAQFVDRFGQPTRTSWHQVDAPIRVTGVLFFDAHWFPTCRLPDLFSLYHFFALEETMAPDRVYDEGDARVFASLEDAHNRVPASLDRMRMFQLQQEIRAGRLEQHDSRRILGLQVADLAAAVARNVYEGTSGATPQRSTKVRGIFRRVLLNDEWLA